MALVGITALVPPEIIYASGNVPLDINNNVPKSHHVPKDKLCAWTAIWRDLALLGEIKLDKLVVVAGGDCNNAIVDGEKIEISGIETHYFTYPFDGSVEKMRDEISELISFLGGISNERMIETVRNVKNEARLLVERQADGKINSQDAFRMCVNGSDLEGNPYSYLEKLKVLENSNTDCDFSVALLGTPPIYSDFHEFLESIGFRVVFDEMPNEFIRHSGSTIDEIAGEYAGYTFARNIQYRVKFLIKELKKRNVDGVIHFHQFACHHKLEDPILREILGKEGYPYISIEGDLPSLTPQNTKLRLEAFKERLGEF